MSDEEARDTGPEAYLETGIDGVDSNFMDPQLSSKTSPVTATLHQARQSPIASEAVHNQPEAAHLVFDNLPYSFQRGYGYSGASMGNLAMQPPGSRTNQYVVVIGNIPWKNTWQDLKDLVRKISPNVERAEIYSAKDGRSLGFGFVRIKGLEEALRVRDALNGYVWHGRALQTLLGNLQYSSPSGGSTSHQIMSAEGSQLDPQQESHPSTINNNQRGTVLSSTQQTQLDPELTSWGPPQSQHPQQTTLSNILLPHNIVYHQAQQPIIQPPLHPHTLHRNTAHAHEPTALSIDASPSSFQPNEALFDKESYLYNLFTQATIQHTTAAGFHQRQADQAMQQAAEARMNGAPGVEELERQAASHREAASYAHSHACYTHSIAQQHLEMCNQLRYSNSSSYSQMQGNIGISSSYPSTRYNAYTTSMYRPGGASANAYQPSYTLPAISVQQQTSGPLPALGTFGGQIPSRGVEALETSIQPHGNAIVLPTPMYFTPSSGLPVNLSHGAVRIERRNVFIGGLPFDTTWRELKEYLRTPLRVDIPRNQNGQKSKGHAFATFESFEAADNACRIFDNTIFKGRTIRVRLDRQPSENIQHTLQSAEVAAQSITIGEGQIMGDGRTQSTQQSYGESAEYKPPVVVDGSTVIN